MINTASASSQESCETPIISLNDNNYIINSTVFGYLLDIIKMKTIEGACLAGKDDRITFGFINKSSEVITKLTLPVNQSISVTSINNDPAFGKDPRLSSIVLTARRIGDLLCVTMPTSRGVMPLVCKRGVSQSSVVVDDFFVECGENHSMSVFNFSGYAISCVVRSVKNIFYPPVSSFAEVKLNDFGSLQVFFRNFVLSTLVLYAIFYGVQIITNPQEFSKGSVMHFLFKLVFVMYFTNVTGNINFKANNPINNYVLPFFSAGLQEFAEMMFNSVNQTELCSFDKKDYPGKAKEYRLWDAIDCRIGAYFGIQRNYNIQSKDPNAEFVPGPRAIQNLDSPSLIVSALAFIGGGNILVLVLIFLFAFLFLQIVFRVIAHYVTCYVLMYALFYLSSLFIPCVLFKQTSQYFQSWLKLIISFMLQPMVVVTAFMMVLVPYDALFFNNCAFKTHVNLVDLHYGNNGTYQKKFNSFELKLPTQDADLCRESVGCKMMRYYMGDGWGERDLIFYKVPYLQDELDVFIVFLKLAFAHLILLMIMDNLFIFAADLTSGINIKNFYWINPIPFALLLFPISWFFGKKKDKKELPDQNHDDKQITHHRDDQIIRAGGVDRRIDGNEMRDRRIDPNQRPDARIDPNQRPDARIDPPAADDQNIQPNQGGDQNINPNPEDE